MSQPVSLTKRAHSGSNFTSSVGPRRNKSIVKSGAVHSKPFARFSKDSKNIMATGSYAGQDRFDNNDYQEQWHEYKKRVASSGALDPSFGHFFRDSGVSSKKSGPK